MAILCKKCGKLMFGIVCPDCDKPVIDPPIRKHTTYKYLDGDCIGIEKKG